MTKSFSLDTNEWRQLLAHNASVIQQFATSAVVCSNMDAQQMLAHLDRMKTIVQAWHVTCQPANGVDHEEPSTSKEEVASPKKRGGWPKGKKRGEASH